MSPNAISACFLTSSKSPSIAMTSSWIVTILKQLLSRYSARRMPIAGLRAGNWTMPRSKKISKPTLKTISTDIPKMSSHSPGTLTNRTSRRWNHFTTWPAMGSSPMSGILFKKGRWMRAWTGDFWNWPVD